MTGFLLPAEQIPEPSAKDTRDDAEVLADTARGSKFRPVDWHDTSVTPPRLVGWGVERKPPDGRFYRPVLADGGLFPFKTKKEAAAKCRELTEKYK